MNAPLDAMGTDRFIKIMQIRNNAQRRTIAPAKNT